jgi:hypothetical protein
VLVSLCYGLRLASFFEDLFAIVSLAYKTARRRHTLLNVAVDIQLRFRV